MKKSPSVNAKIAFYLDPSLMGLTELTACKDDPRTIFTCLVFFTNSPNLLEYFNERHGEGVGGKAQSKLIGLFDSKSSEIFACQIFEANPLTLGGELEELLNRPNFFEKFVFHIVVTKKPVQHFLNFDDLKLWETLFFSEVAERLKSPGCQMHALLPGNDNPVVPLHQLESDVHCACLISLDQYNNKKTKQFYNFANAFNLLTQIAHQKNLIHLQDQKYAEICLRYAEELHKYATAASKEFILPYAIASNRLLEIAKKIFKRLSLRHKELECQISIEENNKIIESAYNALSQPSYEEIKQNILRANAILADKNNLNISNLKKVEKLLEQIQKNLSNLPIESANPNHEDLYDSYHLAKFTLQFEFAMYYKKNDFLIDAFASLKSALISLKASKQKNNYRHLGIVHHHMGLLQNLVNEEQVCNNNLKKAVKYYEQAGMEDAAKKVNLLLYRIELNNSFKENEGAEEECFFELWKSSIENEDWGKFFYLHPIIKKFAQTLEISPFIQSSQKGL